MQDRILAVRRMQEHIAQNTDRGITPGELSRVSGYSARQAVRLFRFFLNITPAGYARRLRLSNAALRLRDENVKIIDAAFDAGYGSVDGFQRAFRKEFGCNPKEYARSPIALYLFTPYYVQPEREERKDNNMENTKVTVQIVSRPQRKAVIKRGKKATHYFEYVEEVGCDIWGLLTSMKSFCGEPVCMWLPQEYIKPGTSEYVQGVELLPNDEMPVPEGFDVIELPEAEYMMFRGETFREEDFEDAISTVWKYETEFDFAALGYERDDRNPRIQMEPLGERGYIEYLPIRKIR